MSTVTCYTDRRCCVLTDRMLSGACVLVRMLCRVFFFFSSRRRHTRLVSDWSSDVCSSDLYRFLTLGSQSPPPFQSMQVRRFTSSGKASRAAISPDGKYVVHVSSDAGKQSLLVRQVTESNNIVVVPPAEVTYYGLTFSLDGAHVYYVVQEQNDPIRVLYQVPALGGVPRKILKDIDSPVAISPDNKQLAFVRRYRGQNEDAVIVTGVD